MIWGFLEERIRNNKTATIYSCNDEEALTYEELLNWVQDICILMKNRLSDRMKCAVICKNKINECAAILSCFKMGYTPILLSENYGEEHCKGIIATVKPNAAIVDDDVYYKLFDVVSFNIATMCVNDLEIMPLTDIQYKELQDVALIMCTSGTTGNPKGVMITESGLISNIEGILEYFNIQKGQSILISRPLYHCAVLTGELLASLVRGLNIWFYSGLYNPFLVKTILDKHCIDVMCGTPTLFKQLSMLYRRNRSKGSLKIIALSGECLCSETARKIRDTFIDTDIYNVYGLTENSPRVSFLVPEQFDERPESVGQPLRNTYISVVDDLGNELSNGKHGNIVISSPSIMKGYYNNKKETDKKISAGKLWTGDIGYKDDQDNLFILSRSDDMIIKAGLNIYPIEIENKALKSPYIKECVAYGTKNQDNVLINMDIVLSSEEMDVFQLKAELANYLSGYLMPDNITVVEQLTRNASGKIVRNKA